MAIKPRCDDCGQELQEFGAILLGPPDKNNKVKKLHICQACYQKIVSKLGTTASAAKLQNGN
jgi:hypothetical protein